RRRPHPPGTPRAVPAEPRGHPRGGVGPCPHHGSHGPEGAAVPEPAGTTAVDSAAAARQGHLDRRHLPPRPPARPAPTRSEHLMTHRADILMITYRSAGYLHLSLPRLLETLGERDRVWLWHNGDDEATLEDRKSTRLNSSHVKISYAVFC